MEENKKKDITILGGSGERGGKSVNIVSKTPRLDEKNKTTKIISKHGGPHAEQNPANSN